MKIMAQMESTKMERFWTSCAGVDGPPKMEVDGVAGHAAQEFRIPAAATRSRRSTRVFTWTAFQVVRFRLNRARNRIEVVSRPGCPRQDECTERAGRASSDWD